MNRPYLFVFLLALGAGAPAWAETARGSEENPGSPFGTREALGQALFFDVNLSRNRTQSCASCHAPTHGFVDNRDSPGGRAASLGDDGRSLGDRNAPTASYAAYSPPFRQRADGVYEGGQFHDGRAATLEEQAAGPFLNPLEMNMPGQAAVVARLQENPAYVQAFTRLFGAEVFADTGSAYDAMTQSIAAFERTEFFAPFDSRYDRYLRGEEQLTAQEELGMELFFSRQFTNCQLCHQRNALPETAGETFTNFEYHNIGVPENVALRARNGVGAGHVDEGLLANPGVSDPAMRGRFKTPTLRNVAVTAPYMHNGVFSDLRTVLLFYNQYNDASAHRQVNPETGGQWRAPEVAGTLSTEELTTGPALSDEKIDALLAFLRTLTDRRYEHLLQ